MICTFQRLSPEVTVLRSSDTQVAIHFVYTLCAYCAWIWVTVVVICEGQRVGTDWSRGYKCIPTTSEVQNETVFGVRYLAVRVKQKVDSIATGRPIAGAKASATHPMAHTEGCITVTVVIIQHQRVHPILDPIHEAVLYGTWRRAYNFKKYMYHLLVT